MNTAILIGRLTKEPDVRMSTSGTAVARFTVAIDRGKDKDGNDRGADFPNVVTFGKQAEIVEKYVKKGNKIGVQGHIQTGSYEKQDGTKVYTTEVIADRIEFLESFPKKEEKDNLEEGLVEMTEDIPF